MRFSVLTIFPQIIDSYIGESILKRAKQKGLIEVQAVDIRKFSIDKHRTVDDRPYGGGPGMILKVEPIFKALKNLGLLKERGGRICRSKKRGTKILILDPAGKKFNQEMAGKLAKEKHLVLICGRYEGFDERVYEFVDEKISLGDYVLSGGEIPALAIVESVARLVPNVLGEAKSLKEETFITKEYVEYPQYTRPEVFYGKRVPKILLSGDHQKIKAWREKAALKEAKR